MAFSIKVPAVGESITEATIGEWMKADGDSVQRDDVLVTLETDKASVEVVAETSGILKTKAASGDVVAIGAVIGEIDEAGAGKSADTSKKAEKAKAPAAKAGVADKGAGNSSDNEEQAPSVRKMANEYSINVADVSGTGRGGRVTKEDMVNYKESGGSAPSHDESPKSVSASKSAAPQATKAPAPQPIIKNGSKEVERVPMTTIRKKIAERLVSAQHTAAILTTFNEVDMSVIMNLRKKHKEAFEKKYNVGLGFMGFFVKAVIEALKEFPKVNGSIEGTDIVYHKYTNIGIAVGTEKGLVVPVIKNAEMMSLAEIELSIKAFGAKARDGKISVDDMSGGTFTISNGGVYGSLMSTPILNPPQSGILGMHKIEERPVAVDGQVVIRPMMYLALSYDHRLIDGSESVRFLVKVKEALEDPTRMLLEI